MNARRCFFTYKWPHAGDPVVFVHERRRGERERLQRLGRVRSGSRARDMLRRRRAFPRYFTLSVYYWSP